MPDHVRLLVRAHLSDSPSRIVNQFNWLSSRRLRAEFPRLPALWPGRMPRPLASAPCLRKLVRRHGGMQNERLWREERAW